MFLNANKETTPLAMRAIVEHSNALHSNVVILSIETLKVPNVPEGEQVTIDDLGYRDDGISHVDRAASASRTRSTSPASSRWRSRAASRATATSTARPTSSRG